MNIYLKISIVILITAIAIISTVYFVGINGIGVWLSGLGASAFIAVIALGFAIWQGWQNQKHNKLSVQPLLEFLGYIGNGDDDEEEDEDIWKYEVSLVNRGLGPAIIESFVLVYDGDDGIEEIPCDDSKKYHNFLINLLKDFEILIIAHCSPGSAVKAGEDIPILGFKYDIENDNVDFIDKIKFLIEYQSIYKDGILESEYENEHGFHKPESNVKHDSKATKMAKIHADCFSVPRPWNKYEFIDMLEDDKMFDVNHTHGFAMGHWLDDTQTELLTLAVYRHEQSRGYGRALLTDFIARVTAEGGQSIFLEVAESNTAALHMYKVAGFKIIGERPAYYEVPDAPPVDAVLMRLDIKTP